MKKILLVFCLLFATFFAVFSLSACANNGNGNSKPVIPQGGNESVIEYEW